MSPLSEADQRQLLRLARQALEESVRDFRVPDVDVAEESLRQHGGAFVTLWKSGRLRGCIGYVEPRLPLYRAVMECAEAAALRDPRFDPVEPHELPLLRLEVSVLSPLADIAPDQIEVGRHGLMISRGVRRGLLLPQVAVEWKWDREHFLEETCLKAGLPPDAWSHGARVQAFSAQVFSESPEAARSSHHAA